MTRSFTKTATLPPPGEPPFYGWRYIEHTGPDGTVEVETVLLTLEDVLHPQEGDVIPENPVHEADRRYLSDVFHAREPRLENGLVLSDCLVNWGVPDIGTHSPDISVFAGLKARPPEEIGTFYVRVWGGSCLAAIELVSPHTRSTDVEGKKEEYHRLKLPLYIMVDQKREHGPRVLRVFRPAPDEDEYAEERPERVLIKELGVFLGLKDNRVVCYDAETSAELGDYTKISAALQAAEKHAQEQTQARAVAEQQLREQTEARAEAERTASEQAQAREAAEKRIRELEAELGRLREGHAQ